MDYSTLHDKNVEFKRLNRGKAILMIILTSQTIRVSQKFCVNGLTESRIFTPKMCEGHPTDDAH